MNPCSDMLDAIWMFRITPAETEVTDHIADDITVFLETYLSANHPASKPPGLEEIVLFVTRVNELHSKSRAVALIARREGKYATSAALLAGSFMILIQGIGVAEVMARLAKTCTNLVAYDDGVDLRACLTAVHYSMSLGWINLFQRHVTITNQLCDQSARMALAPIIKENEESLSSCFNFLIPSKLLLFTTPRSSRIQQAAIDPTRNAALFSRLGVCLVVRVGDRSHPPNDLVAAAFAARGIAVEDLPLGPGGLHMLRNLDVLLTILRAAAGPIAVYADQASQAAARPLLAACLISGSGFAPAAAVAWLLMASGKSGCQHSLSLQELLDSSVVAECVPSDGPVCWTGGAADRAADSEGHFRAVRGTLASSRDGPACREGARAVRRSLSGCDLSRPRAPPP